MGGCQHKEVTETLTTDNSVQKIGTLVVHHGFGVYESYCSDCDNEIESAVCTNAIVYDSKSKVNGNESV